MLREIKKHPDPILRKKCQEVEEITPEIKRLAEDMVETMEKNQGIGLAAPQVGVLKRIVVLQTEQGPAVFVNPKIIKKSKEKETLEEGCLSFPGFWLKIKRAREVEIEGLDIRGKKISVKAEGFIARILQHEIDHLDGVLIIDKVGFFQKLFKLYK